MNITEIEENIKQLTTDFQANKVAKEQFVFDFLLAYGHRKSSVSRVKSGERNLSKVAGEVRWKRHVYFKYVEGDNLRLEADKLKNDKVITRDRIRFVIVTDFTKFLAIDIKTGDSLDIKFDEIVKHFDFFLPWAGMEKAVYQGENPADVKAAEKMAELFDIIKADNFNETNKNDTEALHNLNVFLTRLLFCFFAEDTEIFTTNQFSHAIESHTTPDGSDVANYLNRLFNVLNTSDVNRGDLPEYLAKFPFVNGGLFSKELPAPVFSTKSRKMLIECGKELDWSDINPDIFGSMIQAVVHPEQRSGMGMHYTSVINIMKVIEPLFLDDLNAELENIQFGIDEKLKPNRLHKLKKRLSKIKIFDPACGSGNFLIIAFKELRKLEMDVIKLLQEIEGIKNQKQDDLFAESSFYSSLSEITLSQFYGVELDDFAHEVAILSLWLAEHQMNIEFKTEFGECSPTLPLSIGGNIKSGNALSEDWEQFCPSSKLNEVFILGNPPYIGGMLQTQQQKSDIKKLFKTEKDIRNLDYVACWFLLASKYIKDKNAKFSFVSTNSICQGEQVSYIWNDIFSLKLEIEFAYKPFKWTNSAKGKAGVTCIIIGVRNQSRKDKFIYTNELKVNVKNINGYLTNGDNVVIEKMSDSISQLPKMLLGNQPRDGGYLILSEQERDELINSDERSLKFIKKFYGAKEFLQGNKRWCLWIEEKDVEEAKDIPLINNRINNVLDFRLASKAKTTRGYSNVPYRFAQASPQSGKTAAIIAPKISSERRRYMPIGFLDENCIISDAAFAIYSPSIYLFGIMSSSIHNVWLKAIAGGLETRIRYSVSLCYNNFPIPNINKDQLEKINSKSLKILEVRENHSSIPLGKLYDPESFPDDLKQAHEELDEAVDSLYTDKPYLNDEERLALAFKLNAKMTGGQNA